MPSPAPWALCSSPAGRAPEADSCVSFQGLPVQIPAHVQRGCQSAGMTAPEVAGNPFISPPPSAGARSPSLQGGPRAETGEASAPGLGREGASCRHQLQEALASRPARCPPPAWGPLATLLQEAPQPPGQATCEAPGPHHSRGSTHWEAAPPAPAGPADQPAARADLPAQPRGAPPAPRSRSWTWKPCETPTACPPQQTLLLLADASGMAPEVPGFGPSPGQSRTLPLPRGWQVGPADPVWSRPYPRPSDRADVLTFVRGHSRVCLTGSAGRSARQKEL